MYVTFDFIVLIFDSPCTFTICQMGVGFVSYNYSGGTDFNVFL